MMSAVSLVSSPSPSIKINIISESSKDPFLAQSSKLDISDINPTLLIAISTIDFFRLKHIIDQFENKKKSNRQYYHSQVEKTEGRNVDKRNIRSTPIDYKLLGKMSDLIKSQ